MFPKKHPGKGSGSAVTWTFERWKLGGYKAAWLTGEPVWLDTHFYFVTHPCHSFVTGGKLACPHCQRGRPMAEAAYVPWVDESGKPYSSLVKHYTRPIVDKLRAGDPITVGKGKNKFDPVFVKPREGARQWVPSPGSERTGEQFERWLLTIWKAPELFGFFGVDNPVTLRPAEDTRPINPDSLAEMRRERSLLQYQNWLAGKSSKPDHGQMEEIADLIPYVPAVKDNVAKNGKPV